MSEKILVPVLGESIAEATVSKWLKNEGDKVEADEPIVELETDKVNLEVPSPVSGTLKKILAEDFSLYLHRPTATDTQMAPKGCDCFYVLSPVPNLLSKINWKKEAESYKYKIIKALEETIMPNLSKLLEVSFYMTPNDFEKDYLSLNGTGFSISPIFTQSAWFRFHNKSEDFKNLFFVGAGSHPGAGVPGVVSSAKVLENLISNEN